MLASLNHPNIAHIYGIEDSSDAKALVMELVEGPTLADLIASGHGMPEGESLRSSPRDGEGSVIASGSPEPSRRAERGATAPGVGPQRNQKGGAPRGLKIDDALAIARQVAEALEAAHERGIVHRDLKPANVKVRPDGTVKVLDFGLAKAMERAGSTSSSVSMSPTITTPAMTAAGMILGTAAYMSPEQARGKQIDRRTDVWAFGCVLYEMLTGRHAFPGEDVTDTLAAVVRADPDWSKLPAGLSPTLAAYLKRCLHKDARQRVGDMQDVRLALEGAFETPAIASGPAPPPATAWRRPVPLLLGAVLLAVVGLVAWTAARPASPARVVRFAIDLAAGQNGMGFQGSHVTVSPDASLVAYVATDGIWPRSMDQLQPVHLEGTDAGALGPFFSPDGQSIAFYADRELRRLATAGGTPVTLGATDFDEPPLGSDWGDDGRVLYSRRDGIWQVPAAGGAAALLIPAGEGEYLRSPQMLPGGDRVLLTVVKDADGEYQAQVVAQSVSTGSRTMLVDRGQDARYLATGHLVYGLNNTIFGVPLDVDSLQVVGAAVPLVEGVRVDADRTAAAQFAVSRNGSLVQIQRCRSRPSLMSTTPYVPSGDTLGRP